MRFFALSISWFTYFNRPKSQLWRLTMAISSSERSRLNLGTFQRSFAARFAEFAATLAVYLAILTAMRIILQASASFFLSIILSDVDHC